MPVRSSEWTSVNCSPRPRAWRRRPSPTLSRGRPAGGRRSCPTAPRCPTGLSTGSASPVSRDSSISSPSASTTSPSTTTWSPGPSSMTSSRTTSAAAAPRLVPPDHRLGLADDGELVQGALGADLLDDADAAVGDDHQAEQPVDHRSGGEEDRQQHAEDRVEAREQVRPDDVADRITSRSGTSLVAPRATRSATSVALSPVSTSTAVGDDAHPPWPGRLVWRHRAQPREQAAPIRAPSVSDTVGWITGPRQA